VAFLPLRTELLDLCVLECSLDDPRINALFQVMASSAHRQFLRDLPGYDSRDTGQLLAFS